MEKTILIEWDLYEINNEKIPYTQFEELLVSYIDVDKLIKAQKIIIKNPPIKLLS